MAVWIHLGEGGVKHYAAILDNSAGCFVANGCQSFHTVAEFHSYTQGQTQSFDKVMVV